MKALFIIYIIVSITCWWKSDADSYTEEELLEAQRKFREALCERNNETLYEELTICYEIENHTLMSEFDKCLNTTSHANFPEFIKAGCLNETIFLNFDKCMEPLKEDTDYFIKPDQENEGLICARNVLDKYGLTDTEQY